MAEKKTTFEQLNSGKAIPLYQELLQFIMENKKWWMLPIVVVLAIVSLLVVLTATGLAPFVYTLV